MDATHLALRERRLAAEGLTATCMAVIGDPMPAVLNSAIKLDRISPEDWHKLLLRLND